MIALAPMRRSAADDLLRAPEQRQRRRDHAGAQHAEQRDDALDGIGELDRHHGIGLQPERAQPGGNRRDGAVGFRISQLARRPAGQALAVGRIGERQRVGMRTPARRNRSSSVARLPPLLCVAAQRSCGVPVPPGFRQIAEQRGLRGCSIRVQRATHCSGGK